LNDKPVIGVVGGSSTDFTSEFLKSRHAIALFSYASIRLRIMCRTASSPIEVFIRSGHSFHESEAVEFCPLAGHREIYAKRLAGSSETVVSLCPR
jgi:hypothetical protein